MASESLPCLRASAFSPKNAFSVNAPTDDPEVVVNGGGCQSSSAPGAGSLLALGFGLLVSSLSDSQAMAFQVGMVTSMLPAIFLSGFIFPIRAMPQAVQAITYAVPARYFLVVSRGIILKGGALTEYLRDMGFLVLYASVVLTIAYARLTRREA